MLKFTEGLHRVLAYITAVVLIVMMLHIVTHALLRYFLSEPIYGTNEIVTYWYLPLVALFGIPAASLQKEQITVTLAVDQMQTTTANVFKTFAAILGALMSIGFAWFGLQEALSKMAIGSTAGVTDIVTWPAYFTVPIVFLLLAVLFVGEAGTRLRSKTFPVVEGLDEVSLAMPEETTVRSELGRNN